MKVEVLKHGSVYFNQACPECLCPDISVSEHLMTPAKDPKAGLYVLVCLKCGCEFQIEVEANVD
jgi:transcription elongation factor Elf1